MNWEDVLKVRRRPRKKKAQPANPFAGESKDFKDTVAGKLEAEAAAAAERQAKLDEETKLTPRGRVKFHKLTETEEGGHKLKDDLPLSGKRKPRSRKGVLAKDRCTLCGTRIRYSEAKKLSRGKSDPNKNLGYCEKCAGLLAGTVSSKTFQPLDTAAFKRGRGKATSSPRKHWHGRGQRKRWDKS